MLEPLAINKAKTAVLCMDYQNDIVKGYPSAQETGMLKKAAAVLDAARRAGVPVVYVAVRFRDGYPEVHRVLTEKVFPRQAAVTTSDEFIKAIK